jgi:predicted transcriptional regulator
MRLPGNNQKILHTADRLRILLPATDLDSTRTITERVTQRDLDVETVVSPDVGTLLESAEFKPLVTEMEESGHSRIYVSQDELPFYFGLSDDGRVQIGLADDEGIPRALLETTDETIRNWATEIYESYRSDACQKVIGEL